MPELQKFSFNSVNKAGVIRLLKLFSYISAQQTLMKNNPVLMRKTFVATARLCELTNMFTADSAAFRTVAIMDDINEFYNNS
jgi:hypothetical protein